MTTKKMTVYSYKSRNKRTERHLVQQLEKCMSSHNHESATTTDLGVKNKF